MASKASRPKPRRKGHRSPKHAEAARTNGLKAAAANTKRAGRRPDEDRLDDGETHTDLVINSHAERYQRARAGIAEQTERAKKLKNDIEQGKLMPATQVRTWVLRFLAGFVRELDALPIVVTEVLPDPAQAQIMNEAAAAIIKRIRLRMAAMPELVAASSASKVPK